MTLIMTEQKWGSHLVIISSPVLAWAGHSGVNSTLERGVDIADK